MENFRVDVLLHHCTELLCNGNVCGVVQAMVGKAGLHNALNVNEKYKS